MPVICTFSEANAVIDKAPRELRPFIIIDTLRPPGGPRPQISNQLALELVNRAKSDLEMMAFPPPMVGGTFVQSNPLKYLELVKLYDDFGYRDEALKTFSDFIGFQNLVVRRFAGKNSYGGTISYYYYLLLFHASQRFS